ncbi:MAG: glycosyltransferase [Sediminibacterium sp.]
MMGNIRGKTFDVYNNDSAKTSGQRFFSDLCSRLTNRWRPDEEANPSVILFNVSAPLKLMIHAKLRGKKVVVRIDSLYFDRLSPAFIQTFPRPVRPVLRIGLRWKATHDCLAFLANFLNRNYGAFLRLLIADAVIYQSKFSERIYDRYFRYKKREVIVNGASYKGQECNFVKEGINIALIYDQGRPSKRIFDIVKFIEWANETKHEDIHLTILGYTGIIPEGVSSDLKSIIASKSYIKTHDRFSEYDYKISRIMYESDMYISFSYRDGCPNVVVEAMAHGLPVVGLASGGVPDIVGDAGILIAIDDFAEGFYSAHRFEDDFPPFSLEEMLDAIKTVKANNRLFRQKVRLRFTNELEMDIVVNKYARALNKLIR